MGICRGNASDPVDLSGHDRSSSGGGGYFGKKEEGKDEKPAEQALKQMGE